MSACIYLEVRHDSGGLDECQLPQALRHHIPHALLLALAVGEQQPQDLVHVSRLQVHLAAHMDGLPGNHLKEGEGNEDQSCQISNKSLHLKEGNTGDPKKYE